MCHSSLGATALQGGSGGPTLIKINYVGNVVKVFNQELINFLVFINKDYIEYVYMYIHVRKTILIRSLNCLINIHYEYLI